jgi:hypothetical protein
MKMISNLMTHYAEQNIQHIIDAKIVQQIEKQISH